MTAVDFIRLLLRHKWILLLFPLCMALAVVFFTANTKRDYVSRALVYTGLASGMDMAQMDNPLFNTAAINNSFDNLISTIKARETVEEVCIRLLAKNILIKPKDKEHSLISAKTWERLGELLRIDQKDSLVADNYEKTVANIYAMKHSSEKNTITQILDGKEIYSVFTINNNLALARKQNSDMLELSYKANDPYIAQETLEILLEVLPVRYKNLKANESTDVIAYFEQQIDVSLDELNRQEDAFKNFCAQHGILNYYEQSKTLSEAKMNAETQLNAEVQNYNAAKEAEQKITKKMSTRRQMADVNDAIIEKQDLLSGINKKITSADIAGNTRLKAKYKAEALKLKKEIDENVNQLYGISNSEEGVDRKDLMQSYLDKNITAEESKSKVKVIQDRIRSFDDEYQRMSPIGTQVKKMERAILVAEQKYLAAVRNYEEAKLKDKSLNLTNNISVLDKPYYPLKSEPSKRLILVIAALFAGLVLPLSVILGIYLLDNSIKDPHKAQELTDLSVSGVLNDRDPKETEVNYPQLEKILIEQMHGGLMLDIAEKNLMDKRTKKIQVYSNKSGEGKLWCALRMANKMAAFNEKVLLLHPDDTNFKITEEFSSNLTTHSYKKDPEFLLSKDYEELMRKNSIQDSDYTTIILVIPSLMDYQLPISLIRDTDLSIMVIDSQRVWTSADSHLLSLYMKAFERRPSIWLNKVTLDVIENILGEIPKKRSKIRLLIRNLLSLNFSFIRTSVEKA